MMMEDVVVEPMTEKFIVWRCLHDGPLARDATLSTSGRLRARCRWNAIATGTHPS